MATRTTLSTLSSELADLVQRSASLVVAVDGRHRRSASGIIFGPDLVVTADHVLERDEHIHVRQGERRLAAEIAGRDPGTDIAVLRVSGLGGAEPPHGGDVRPGQLVISLSRTPTAAEPAAGVDVIAALGGPLRTGSGAVLPQVFRTSAALYPGASGGAILDTEGRVLGMSTSGLLRGLPVVIPSAQLWDIAGALAKNSRPKRAHLGVSVVPVRFPAPVAGADGGLLVSGLKRDGAAHSSGILIGDVIVTIEGRPLEHANDLQDRLAAVEAGATIALGIVRGGRLEQHDVVTGQR